MFDSALIPDEMLSDPLSFIPDLSSRFEDSLLSPNFETSVTVATTPFEDSLLSPNFETSVTVGTSPYKTPQKPIVGKPMPLIYSEAASPESDTQSDDTPAKSDTQSDDKPAKSDTQSDDKPAKSDTQSDDKPAKPKRGKQGQQSHSWSKKRKPCKDQCTPRKRNLSREENVCPNLKLFKLVASQKCSSRVSQASENRNLASVFETALAVEKPQKKKRSKKSAASTPKSTRKTKWLPAAWMWQPPFSQNHLVEAVLDRLDDSEDEVLEDCDFHTSFSESSALTELFPGLFL